MRGSFLTILCFSVLVSGCSLIPIEAVQSAAFRDRQADALHQVERDLAEAADAIEKARVKDADRFLVRNDVARRVAPYWKSREAGDTVWIEFEMVRGSQITFRLEQRRSGWAGIATHPALEYRRRCVVYYGAVSEVPATEAGARPSAEGEIVCDEPVGCRMRAVDREPGSIAYYFAPEVLRCLGEEETVDD